MTRQRRSSTGDIRTLLPEGKPARWTTGRRRWAIGAAIVFILVLALPWKLFMKRA